MNFINFNNYFFKYSMGKENALKNINLEINQGEIICLVGKSGSGKSTLLKCIKENIKPFGTEKGFIKRNIEENQIGIVFQNPDTQLVNQTVIDDLVFHMENLGYLENEMKKNLIETVSFFGLENILHKKTNDLSGGQKQIIALCSALMIKPKLLLLDEPISQLDPIATKEFLDTLIRVNEELGITILIVEHNLDDLINFADKIILIDEGKILEEGKPKKVFKNILENNKDKELFVPEIPRLSMNFLNEIFLSPKDLKINIKSNQKYFVENFQQDILNKKLLLELKNISFAYEKNSNYVLENLNLKIYDKEKICIIGGNGSGKSTLLKIISKILKPLDGIIKNTNTNLKISYIPQDISSYFRFDTVEEELLFSNKNNKIDLELIKNLDINNLFKKHPLDLSGGEMQKVVFACVILSEADLIIMDEPTKGIDPYGKEEMKKILNDLDKPLIISTHDLDFGISVFKRGILLFDKEIGIDNKLEIIFQNNFYYTTTINKAMGHIFPNAFTFLEVRNLCQKEKIF